MLPASNKGAGGDVVMIDVCKTPAGPVVVPVPYPNFAMNAMAVAWSPNVLWTFLPALNQASIIPLTMGDEAGVAGGLASGIIKGPSVVTMGNPIVFVNMLPAKNLTCLTASNMFNAPIGACLIPSITQVLLTRDGVTTIPAVGEAVPIARCEVEDLADALAEDDVASRIDASGVRWLRIGVFTKRTRLAVFNALRELGAELGGDGPIGIDLRGNRGGDLAGAIDLAKDFLDAGDRIATLEDADGDETVFQATKRGLFRAPVVVLVDGGTASAAEVFAAALQASGRAVVAGERTVGKLTAQRMTPSADGDLYASVARVVLAGGVDQRWVEPDVVVTAPREDGAQP